MFVGITPLVNSTVDSNMVSTRKKKELKKKLLRQLSESDADFMIGQRDHKTQTESRDYTADRNISVYYTKDPSLVKSPQVDMHTLEKNIVDKVRSAIDSVMTTVETRV